MFDPGLFLLLCATVGLLGLDATAALQVMVSRPLVVGAVVGALLGDLSLGLVAGGLIELLWMGGLPVGSLVPADGAVAAATAAATAVQAGSLATGSGGVDAAVSLGVLLAVPAGWLGAHAEIAQRRWMDGLGRRAEAAVERGETRGLGRVLLAALGLAWLRGALATAACLALLPPFAVWVLVRLPPDALRALEWSFWLFWLLGLAVAADHFWDRKGLKYAALLLLGLAVAGTRPGMDQGQVLALLVTAVHLLGLWRWWRALRGEATA